MRVIDQLPALLLSGTAALLGACRSDPPDDVVYFTVEADLPSGVEVMFYREFESVQGWVSCKAITAVDGSFVPLRKVESTSLSDHKTKTTEASVLDGWNWCTWNFLGASAELVIKPSGLKALSVEFTGKGYDILSLGGKKKSAGCKNVVRAECLKCRGETMEAFALECRYSLDTSETVCGAGNNPRERRLKFDVSFLNDKVMDYIDCRKQLSIESRLKGNTFSTIQSGEEPMANITKMDVSGMDMDAGYSVSLQKGDRLHLNVTKAPPETIRLRLAADENNPASVDDKFRLFSADRTSYDKTLSVKDDMVPNNGYLDLLYEGVNSSLYYSMEVIPGGSGQKYFIFENRKFE